MTDLIVTQWKQGKNYLSKRNISVNIPKFQEIPLHKEERPHRIRVYVSDHEHKIIIEKAKAGFLSQSEFIRRATLGSNYEPPINPELRRILLALNCELTDHGRSFRKIACLLTEETVSSKEIVDVLEAFRGPLIETLRCVKNALVQGGPQS